MTVEELTALLGIDPNGSHPTENIMGAVGDIYEKAGWLKKAPAEVVTIEQLAEALDVDLKSETAQAEIDEKINAILSPATPNGNGTLHAFRAKISAPGAASRQLHGAARAAHGWRHLKR